MDLSKYCKDVISSEEIDLFKTNVRIICAGSSNSGKTQIVNQLIIENHNKFDKIFICGSPHKNILEQNNVLKDRIITFEHFPSIKEINDFDEKLHKLLLLDDAYVTAFSNINVLSYFTHGRHSNISCILITQNLFYSKGKFSRDISLNSTHIILLRIRDLSQIAHLSRQIYGKGLSSKIPDVYKFIAKKYKYPHLLIDVSGQVDEKLELRSHITRSNENRFQTVYIYN